MTAILDAILDLTAFRYSDFGIFLVCYSPPQTVPETVKKPLSNFLGFDPILSYIYLTITAVLLSAHTSMGYGLENGMNKTKIYGQITADQ